MASIIKNLDTILSQAINGPKVQGIPLYAKVDGTQEKGFNNSTVKSVEWEKESLVTFTSPTNIRRVFISGNRVMVQLYKPAIVKGKPDNNGCWREFHLKKDNNLIEIATNSLNYQQRMNQYYMEKNINPKAEAPDKITIKGTGLGALSSPFVLSNIEEVYFDWSILASEVYRNAAIGCEELLAAYIQGKRGFMQGNIALDMFVMANSCNIKDIRNRFPRLKCVGLVSELSKILEVKFDRGRNNVDSVKESGKLWSMLETNINLIKQSNSLVVINEIKDGIPTYNTNFSVRDGIYKYDRDILKPFVEEYTKRVKDYLRNGKEESEKASEAGNAVASATGEKANATVSDQRTIKSELEMLLDNLAETRCLADAKSVLILSLSGAKVSEVNEAFSEMSSEGEKKYRALLK